MQICNCQLCLSYPISHIPYPIHHLILGISLILLYLFYFINWVLDYYLQTFIIIKWREVNVSPHDLNASFIYIYIYKIMEQGE